MQICTVGHNRAFIIINLIESGECAQLKPLDRFQDWGLWEDSTFTFGKRGFVFFFHLLDYNRRKHF